MLTLIVKLAIRNVFKYRKRTAVIMVVIMVAVFCTQFTFAFMDGFMSNMLNQLFDNYGHVVLTREGYQEKAKLYPLDYTIENAPAVLKDISTIPHLKSVRTLIFFGAVAEGKEYSIPLICMGISVGEDPTSKRWRDNILRGTMIEPDGKGIVIGDELAAKLDVDVGQSIILTTGSYYGGPAFLEAPVKAVCDTHIKAEKAQMIVMPVGLAAETLYLPGDAIQIQINLTDTAHLPEVREGLRQIAKKHGLEVETYLDKFAAWLGVMEQSAIFVNFIFGLIVIIAGTTIVNTVLTSVFERFRDFGTLRAVGLSKTGLFTVIVLEAAINSLLAVILINCITVPFIYYYSVHGINFGSAMDTMDGLSRVFYMGFSFDIFLNGSLVGLLAGIASAAYPAWIAVRKNVVEALRYV
ncbi:ABC transporter permease [Planctomycetota bacterium]